jgi:hypothetical protein
VNLCTVKARWGSDKRWRSSTFSGTRVLLRGIDEDNRWTGELMSVHPWIFYFWYVPVAHVATEVFARPRLIK